MEDKHLTTKLAWSWIEKQMRLQFDIENAVTA